MLFSQNSGKLRDFGSVGSSGDCMLSSDTFLIMTNIFLESIKTVWLYYIHCALDNMLGRKLPSSSLVDILTDQTIYGIKKFQNGITVPNNTLLCAQQLSDLSTYLASQNYLTSIPSNYLTTSSSIQASQLTGLFVITALSGLSLPASQLTGLSTITTLSGLSLPASQLTGLSTITTLSGLSLPTSQLTENMMQNNYQI
jgi:hypothetical protein